MKRQSMSKRKMLGLPNNSSQIHTNRKFLQQSHWILKAMWSWGKAHFWSSLLCVSTQMANVNCKWRTTCLVCWSLSSLCSLHTELMLCTWAGLSSPMLYPAPPSISWNSSCSTGDAREMKQLHCTSLHCSILWFYKALSVHHFHPSSLLFHSSQGLKKVSDMPILAAGRTEEHTFLCPFYSSFHALFSLTLLLLHGSEVFKGESAHGRPPEGIGLHNGFQPCPVQWK